MRKCMVCGAKIKASMGFVLARDIVDRRIPVREICGKCGLEILEMDEIQLNRKITEWVVGSYEL